MAASSDAKPLLLFVSGDRSGVGKSSVCLGLLGALLESGIFKADELAYIKPCTQCEDVQLVSKFCHKKGIAHQGLGPVRFYQGFTSRVINGEEQETAEGRLERIQEAVDEIGAGKKFVLVDGVGYCAVGSVAGVSNADVARKIGAPVLVVGRPGIGNAIDSFNMIRIFFGHHGVRVLGAVFNNVPKQVSYHTYESCKAAVSKYFAQREEDGYHMFGMIPRDEARWEAKVATQKDQACILRESETDLQLSEDDAKLAQSAIQGVRENVDVDALVEALRGV